MVTEKTKEELVTELDAARRRIAELESKAHTIRCSQWTRCSSRYESLVKLYELEIDSLQELFDFALEQALVLTESTLGYIYFYDETTEVFTLYSWSKNATSHCKVADKPNRFLLKDTGLWGEVVRQRKEIVVNNFSCPNRFKKGYQDGHVDIHNFLSIPVWKGESIVAVVGVGNKESDYTEFDIQQLDLFAKGVWVVAQRKGAEEALRLSEERYRSVVEDQTELISRTTPEGIILFVNEIYCRFFGITAGDIVGSNWAPAVAPDDIHMVQNILNTFSPDSPVVTIEIRVFNALNEIRWMQFVNRAIFDKNSNIVEIQSVGRDITERKTIEEELKESELRWKFALEGSGDGIWDWDIAKNTLFFSHGCNLMLGY
ncbi:GAF domain-containing protein [Solidesulfovibrio magneticus]|uniref:histidine kinase n=1 Tax=Solidesulfovibrio magneticus (strain ATCC 700980 / DSM 13731 / RS-1) TaxID=573370 RepID=C4XJC9_SOLM1|nr:GAF domain-containing protein [Solidesulfovibrio magneticus]BAH76679.1 putative signaling protein [Solidesulfovibrio magneticus RS-1]